MAKWLVKVELAVCACDWVVVLVHNSSGNNAQSPAPLLKLADPTLDTFVSNLRPRTSPSLSGFPSSGRIDEIPRNQAYYESPEEISVSQAKHPL